MVDSTYLISLVMVVVWPDITLEDLETILFVANRERLLSTGNSTSP